MSLFEENSRAGASGMDWGYSQGPRATRDARERREIKGPKLPIFKGEPHLAEEWLRELRKRAKLSGLSEEETILEAWAYSKGEASDFIEKLIDDGCKELDDFAEAVWARYEPGCTVAEAISALTRVRQRPEETLSELATRMGRLASQAYPEAGVTEKRSIQRQLASLFIAALTDREVRIAAVKENPDDLQCALDVARKAQQQWGIIRRMDTKVDKNQGVSSPKRPQRPKEERGRYWPPPNRSTIVCWTCNRGGHKAPDCPTRRGPSQDPWCGKCRRYGHLDRDCGSRDGPQIGPPVSHKKNPPPTRSYAPQGRGGGNRTPPETKKRIAPIEPEYSWACWGCGELGHWKWKCPRRKCWICDQSGHFQRDCPQLTNGRREEEYLLPAPMSASHGGQQSPPEGKKDSEGPIPWEEIRQHLSCKPTNGTLYPDGYHYWEQPPYDMPDARRELNKELGIESDLDSEADSSQE